MRPELENLEIPAGLAAPTDRARYCRSRVTELLAATDEKHEEGARFELLNLAERWLTLAFHHPRQTN